MRRSRLVPALLLASAAVLAPNVSLAVQQPPAFAGRPELERFDGFAQSLKPASAAVRGWASWGAAPRATAGAYATFLTDMAARGGYGFRASFDPQSGVPSRIFGAGVDAPGCVADGALAEAFASELLDAHIRLLAPGSATSDFVLVSNDLDAGMRTLGFVQTAGGLGVRGGQVSFRFKNDRLQMIGSEALPNVPAFAPSTSVDGNVARQAALAWVEADFGAADVTAVGEALVLPYRTQQGSIGYVQALPVEVETRTTAGRFEVFVDLASGRPVARQQLLHFASSSVLLHVPLRAPVYGPRFDAPAVLANINIEGSADLTGLAGTVNWAGADPTEVELFLSGTRVKVLADDGPEASLTLTIADAAPLVWDASDDAPIDAQLSTFIHAEKVREFARTFAPQQSFLNQQVQATVNIAEVCNAYSDGTTINFYGAGQGCENTGRIADVIYHEYGHSIHAHAVIEGVGAFEGALSEGQADYLAATITGDPATARGFFQSPDELRHLDPAGQENVWPDDLQGEVHADGLIIGQALWDLRKELVTKLGETEGVLTANQLYYQGIRRAVDIPTMYPEILAADDDDGDLTNGTPNVCEINRAFALHGLRSAVGTESATLGVTLPKQEGFDVSVELFGLYPQCPGEDLQGGTLAWHDRENPSVSGEVALSLAGNVLSGTIPSQPAGTVVRYQIDVALDGSSVTLPNNAADPEYEFFVGEVVPLYCTDFESDPVSDGWTHGLESGEVTEGADDWAWGDAKGDPTNNDPAVAYSGDKVFGNDLRVQDNFNGLYQPDKVNYAKSPVVDTQGHSNVRLQYRRWLNVEDAQFDKASILGNDTLVWRNLDSQQGNNSRTHHLDREWRFQDVDLSNVLDASGTVQVTYKLSSDGGAEFGGWTIDDFCIVAYETSAPPPCEGTDCGEGGGGSGQGGGSGDDADPDLKPEGGCGCDLAAAPANTSWFALAALGLVGLRARRRKGLPASEC